MNKGSPLTVVVFAGGRGTRLKHLTEEVPKAMIDVAGRPLFHYSIGFAKCFNPAKIIFSGSHLFDTLSKAVTTYDPTITMVKDIESSPGKRILGMVSVKNHIVGDVLLFDGDYIYHRSIAEQMFTHTYSAVTVHGTRKNSPYMLQDMIADLDDAGHLLSMRKTTERESLAENQTYFNSLFYCPENNRHEFFTCAEDAWRTGSTSAEDAVVRYVEKGNSVDVVNFEKPLWMEIDTLNEREMGEKFIADYKNGIALD